MFVGGKVGDDIAKYLGLRDAVGKLVKEIGDPGYPFPDPLHHWCCV
jgi:hypothetical protein